MNYSISLFILIKIIIFLFHKLQSSRHQTEVVKLLVDSDVSKRTLHTKADNGSLPLHTAVRYGAPPSVIELLLDGDYDKSTLFQSDCYGQLPLHAACRNGASPAIIQLLLHHDEAKQTILQEDMVGRIPIHLALLHTTENQLAVLQVLLHGMLCGRMERKGINLWKIEMKSLLKSMTETTHERSFTTRDKLDMVCESIQQFMERVFVLELAVWRASCLKFDARFGSMEEVLEHESQLLLLENDGGDDLVLDVHGYKVDRRIMSGADVVIHHVIPFLEDEPVEDLMQQFRDYS